MKKAYEAPRAEKVEFHYQEQVAAASGGSSCTTVFSHENVGSTMSSCCTTPVPIHINN